MSTFKKAKVIILPTTNDSNIYLKPQNGHLVIVTDTRVKRHVTSLNFPKQHLYIISDDEIKEGDWFYNIHSKIVGRAEFNFGKDELAKKIIATTDTSLGNYIWKQTNKKSKLYNIQQNIETTKKVFIPLPQSSQQFIEKYIEEYNKGQQITECLVEYEEIYPKHFTYNPNENIITRLKVDKNNIITIKKVKDSYTQEEVDRLLDEKASKTTAEMLEKFKDYKRKDEVIKFAEKYARMVTEKKIGLNAYKFIHNRKWIEENL